MYARKHFKEEYMTKYEMIPTNEKDDRSKTLTYSTTLYAMRKAYSEDRAAESGFESVDKTTHITRATSVGHASIKLNRGREIGIPEN